MLPVGGRYGQWYSATPTGTLDLASYRYWICQKYLGTGTGTFIKYTGTGTLYDGVTKNQVCIIISYVSMFIVLDILSLPVK